MDEATVDTGWVKICPLLQIEAPHPLAGDHDVKSREVKAIYDYFRAENPSDPYGEFKKIYNRLPVIPEAGETKLAQLKRVVSLLKISRDALSTSRSTRKALKTLGIK